MFWLLDMLQDADFSFIELSELPGNFCWGYSSWATMVMFHSRVGVDAAFQ